MRDRRGVLWLLRLVLSGDDDGEAVHDGHHDPLVGTAATFHRVSAAPLLVGHRTSEDSPAVEIARVPLILLRPRSRGMTLRSFEEPHHVRFYRIRLAHRRRQLLLVFVRLGVRVVTLNGHGVPHAWWYNVRQALDCVSGVDFVAGHTRNLVHSAG